MKRIYPYLVPLFLLMLGGVVALSLHQRSTIVALRLERAHLSEQLGSLLAADTLASAHLSVGRLRMSRGEVRDFRPQHVKQIESLGLRMRRIVSLSESVATTRLDTITPPSESAPLPQDSIGSRPLASTPRHRYEFHDGWVSLGATLRGDSLEWHFHSRDTLLQVVHRVPHRWWIFSWGTRAIRQEIRSSNPHTRLVYAEYIELE